MSVQGGLGRNQLQWSVCPFLRSLLLFYSSLVCQTDNACANFPIRGDLTSLDTTDSVNMTCYKDGQTVFSNHQFCDVTSTHISTCSQFPLMQVTQIGKSLICYPAALLRLHSAATRQMRHVTFSFGLPRSSRSIARLIPVR